MGKKKSKKKHKKDQKKSKNAENTSALNSEIKDLGAALVGVIVGEIAQAVVNRMTQPNGRLNSSEEQPGIVTTASTLAHHAVTETQPSVEQVIGVVKELVEEVKPTIIEVFKTLKQRSGDVGESVVDVATQIMEPLQDSRK